VTFVLVVMNPVLMSGSSAESINKSDAEGYWHLLGGNHRLCTSV